MAEDALPSASPSATVPSSAFASASAAAASVSLELEQNRALLPRSTELRPPLSVPRTLSSGDLSSAAAATAGAAANRAGKMAAAAAAARSMLMRAVWRRDSRVFRWAAAMRSFGLFWFGEEEREESEGTNEATKPFQNPRFFINLVLAAARS